MYKKIDLISTINGIRNISKKIGQCEDEERHIFYAILSLLVAIDTWYGFNDPKSFLSEFNTIWFYTLFILIISLFCLNIWGILRPKAIQWAIRWTFIFIPLTWGQKVSQKFSASLKTVIIYIGKYWLASWQAVFLMGVILLIINNFIFYPQNSFSDIVINISKQIKGESYLSMYIFLFFGVFSISINTGKRLLGIVIDNLGLIFGLSLGTSIALVAPFIDSNLSKTIESNIALHIFLLNLNGLIIIMLIAKGCYKVFFKNTGNGWFEYYWNDAIEYGRGNKQSSSNAYVEETLKHDAGEDTIPYFLDNPIVNKKEDELCLQKTAENIYNKIYKLKSPPKNYAINIGIEGSRGSGKTSLVNILKHDFLDKVPGSVRYFDFNVWSHTDNLVGCFLTEFKNFLLKEGIISNKIGKQLGVYIEKLGFEGPSIDVIKAVTSFFNKEETTQDIYEEIAQSINISGKRIVIFIDDVDRLSTWDKWSELFSILRASASFSNVFFVVCFSNEEISRMWGEKYNRTKEADIKKEVDRYIEKIFNFTFELDYSIYTIADGSNKDISNYYEKLSNLLIQQISDDILSDNNFKTQAEKVVHRLFNKWKDMNIKSDVQLKVLDNFGKKPIDTHIQKYLYETLSQEVEHELFSKILISKLTDSLKKMKDGRDRNPRFIKNTVNLILEIFYEAGAEKMKDGFIKKVEELESLLVPIEGKGEIRLNFCEYGIREDFKKLLQKRGVK